MTNLNTFCGGSPFWNTTLLLESWYPHLTQCFQLTILVWVPCLFLWLTLPMYIYHLRHLYKPTALPLTKLSIIKTILCALLAILSLIELVPSYSNNTQISTALIVSITVRVLTFLLAGGLCQVSRKYGIPSPCLPYLFWFLSLLVNIIPFYTIIIQKIYETDVFRFILFCVYYFLILTQLVVHSFSEAIQPSNQKDFDKEPCPLLNASFSSKIFFWWTNNLVITGYKKSITDEDVFDLPEDFKNKNLAPPFLSTWDKKLRKERQKVKLQKSDVKNKVKDGNVDGGIPLLQPGEIPLLPPGETPQLHQTVAHPTIALFIVLLKVFWADLLKCQITRFFSEMMVFINPLLLKIIIDYKENNPKETDWKGYVLVLCFSLLSFAISAFHNQVYFKTHTLGLKVKSSLVAAVYRKALTMNSNSRRQYTLGAIVNLISEDCQRVAIIPTFIWIIWLAPIQISIALYLLNQTLGVSFVAGIGVIVLVIPLNSFLSTKMGKADVEILKIKDERLKITHEVLSGIKVLKLFAWEKSFRQKIMDIRSREIKCLRKCLILQAFSTFCWHNAPVLVGLASFVMYILMSETRHLDASTAFVALSLFNVVRAPMDFLPSCIFAFIESLVSVGRLGKYLCGGDLDADSITHKPDNDNAIKIENGAFSWNTDLSPNLQNINIKIGHGELVAVVGPVGAGKSSLLSAMLGEMDKLTGHINIQGSIAYVPQQAWIQNLSLRNNILFGEKLTDKYWETIECCALKPDLNMLPGGEATEIGEKGINLSGGQKQRVNLARAVYSNKDVYLLDDPLSAVDSHVGKHIFNEVIGKEGVLKDKTRILVTHGIHWLPLVDKIIVMDQGQITEFGSYEELINHEGAFAKFVTTYMLSEIQHTNEELDSPSSDNEDQVRPRSVLRSDSTASDHEHPHRPKSVLRLDSTTSDTMDNNFKLKATLSLLRLHSTTSHSLSYDDSEIDSLMVSDSMENVGEIINPSKKQIDDVWSIEDNGGIIEEENIEVGKIEFRVLKTYVSKFGVLSAVVTLVLFLVYQLTNVGANIWLNVWTENTASENLTLIRLNNITSDSFYYLGIYSGLSILQGLASCTYMMAMYISMVRIAGTMFSNLLWNILRQPMSFFDKTPTGRIMNRFTKDVDTIDGVLHHISREWFETLFRVLSIIVVISYSTPLFLVTIVPLFLVYFFIQRFYIPTSRQLRRNESIARSPLYSHITETINGASCVRAYSAVDKFCSQSQDRMDRCNMLNFAVVAISRWLRVRLEFIGNITVLCACILAITRPDVTGSDIGLSLTYALGVTSSLNQLVANSTQLEVNIVSIERVLEYTEIPQEAVWYKEDIKLDPKWPEDGGIRLFDFQTRYRSNAPLVLKGITCNILPGEKIGIVGRTGAGKSSLSMALFRIIECCGGQILIDGVDISTLGLHDLRSRLTILPQDPVLFTGTLRMNLDPFEEHSDEEIWTALDHVHLNQFIAALPEGLYHQCDEGGQNLSVGQQQLVCLARSLLKKTKILILDEATAAVDMETDELIQQTIRSQFKDCTVLSIAHRLNTIVDYDRIMVMTDGQIKEFDKPEVLLNDSNGLFYSMAKDANLIS